MKFPISVFTINVHKVRKLICALNQNKKQKHIKQEAIYHWIILSSYLKHFWDGLLNINRRSFWNNTIYSIHKQQQQHGLWRYKSSKRPVTARLHKEPMYFCFFFSQKRKRLEGVFLMYKALSLLQRVVNGSWNQESGILSPLDLAGWLAGRPAGLLGTRLSKLN